MNDQHGSGRQEKVRRVTMSRDEVDEYMDQAPRLSDELPELVATCGMIRTPIIAPMVSTLMLVSEFKILTLGNTESGASPGIPVRRKDLH